jgi:putative transposase
VLAPEDQLRARLRQISRTWPRYGFRRAWALLRLQGWVVNRKRVQRLWREEGLKVRPWAPKRRRLGTSTVPAQRLRAERPNHVWAIDFIFDATSDGRPIKALSMCDEFTRENLARRLGRSVTADDVVDALDEACATRGAPEFIRCDNGPEFIAVAIQDWCRFRGVGTAYIEPGSPVGNALRRELQRQGSRRALRPRDLRLALRGPRALGRLLPRLQSRATAQLSRILAAGGLRSGSPKPGTLVEGGLVIGDRSAARPPGPVQPPARAVPADHGLWPHDRYLLPPSAGPQASQPDPEDPVAVPETWAGVCPQRDVKLMA